MLAVRSGKAIRFEEEKRAPWEGMHREYGGLP